MGDDGIVVIAVIGDDDGVVCGDDDDGVVLGDDDVVAVVIPGWLCRLDAFTKIRNCVFKQTPCV